jgi:mRNA-degrading endonuclease YafQ of YafQ-DinJ toxin-antitoxin module
LTLREKNNYFQKNSADPQLHSHTLHEPYEGLKSITISNDYRAIYEEVTAKMKTIA